MRYMQIRWLKMIKIVVAEVGTVGTVPVRLSHSWVYSVTQIQSIFILIIVDLIEFVFTKMKVRKFGFIFLLFSLLSFYGLSSAAGGCPSKVSDLCECLRWIEGGLRVVCTNVDLDEVVNALEESGELIRQLKVQSSNIPILLSRAFAELSIKELHLQENNIAKVPAGLLQF